MIWDVTVEKIYAKFQRPTLCVVCGQAALGYNYGVCEFMWLWASNVWFLTCDKQNQFKIDWPILLINYKNSNYFVWNWLVLAMFRHRLAPLARHSFAGSSSRTKFYWAVWDSVYAHPKVANENILLLALIFQWAMRPVDIVGTIDASREEWISYLLIILNCSRRVQKGHHRKTTLK